MTSIRIIAAACMLAVVANPAIGATSEKLAKPVSIGGQGTNGPALSKLDSTRPTMRELHFEQIQKTIQKYLEGEWGTRVKSVQVTLLEPLDPIKIPVGVIELQIPSVAGGSTTMGRRSFSIQVMVNGNAWKTVDALADISAMIDVVVPARFLKSEETIEPDDLTTARIVTYDVKHPFITDPEVAIGKSTVRPLQPNTPLRPTFLKKPFMVKKGDHVMIEARRGNFSVQTSGVTKGSGQVGQTVMVANLDSGRELRAKIVAPGLVQVEF
jgi:flagella basal body P-ring formation protein FlgA